MTEDIRCLNSIIRWQIHLSSTSVFAQRRLHSRCLSVLRIAFVRLPEECNRPRTNGDWTILRPSACKLNGECVCLLRLFRASHQCKYVRNGERDGKHIIRWFLQHSFRFGCCWLLWTYFDTSPTLYDSKGSSHSLCIMHMNQADKVTPFRLNSKISLFIIIFYWDGDKCAILVLVSMLTTPARCAFVLLVCVCVCVCVGTNGK